MGEKLVIIKLTYEQARLLSDSLSASFIQNDDDPGTVMLSTIGDKIFTAMEKARRAARKGGPDEA